MKAAIVHDYLTQRGGAERVVLSLRKAFPDAPIYTSLYDPGGTYAEFRDADVRTLDLDRIAPLRRHHRAAFPLLAAAFSRLRVEADVVLCSSSGWAHGAASEGRKVVYCHTPARWLYQPERYLGERSRTAARVALALQAPFLRRWDRRAANSASRYLANSSAVRDRIRAAHGIDAEVLPPPHGLGPDGARLAVAGIEPGFVLCVSRLLPYKNVGAVAQAFAELPDEQLIVVGTGPERRRLPVLENVRVVERAADEELRWLYASCRGVVSASYEDFGLTTIEAAAFGKPAAVLRFGGFRDTVVEGLNGLFFERPEARDARAALSRMLATPWDAEAIRRHAERFSEAKFVDRMRAIAAEAAA